MANGERVIIRVEGQYLVTGDGKPLYHFLPQKEAHDIPYARDWEPYLRAWIETWEPLLTDVVPEAGPGVNKFCLAITSSRKDVNRAQAMYRYLQLYTFRDDGNQEGPQGRVEGLWEPVRAEEDKDDDCTGPRPPFPRGP